MILHDVLGPFGVVGGLLVIAAAVYVALDNGYGGDPTRSSESSRT
jgi:hypothetical protein